VIEALVSAGLTVYGNDHRGHGRTAPSAAHFGDFGEGGFDLLVEDMIRLSRVDKEENPNKQFILLGHSIGSFAAQQYALDHSREINGLVLSGSGALDGLARLASSVPPGKNILNTPFEPARTPFDWLSRDSALVDAFINEPPVLCTISARVLCIVSRGCASTVRPSRSPQDTRRLATLPVFGKRRSRGPATSRSGNPDRALSQSRHPRHLP
jgi:alpha-beta hydrolase superfamily lysophospholipase